MNFRLFSYIIRSDSGCAPNPFWGYCTLACCKPKIRKVAKPGDWVVALSSKAKEPPHYKIVYAMQVEKTLSLSDYFNSPQFAKKKPDMTAKNLKYRVGDNFYERRRGGKWEQHPSMHSKYDKEKGVYSDNPEAKKTDLGGENVLISKNFYYFGSRAIPLPESLGFLKIGIGHRSRFTDEQIKKFLKFIKMQKRGIHAKPTKWREDDNSWKQGCK